MIPSTGRTLRVVTLLRWLVVGVHTTLVVSAGFVHFTGGRSSAVQRIIFDQPTLFMILDLPVAFFAVSLDHISSPTARAVLFFAMYVLLGGLQWYLIASLIAAMTCGFSRAIPVASRRFRLTLVLGLILVVGGAVSPWTARLTRALRLRGYLPDARPAVAFRGDSGDLRQSVVVPTLDTPIPEGMNAIWCATFQMAWDRLKNDVIGEPVRVANAEDLAHRLNRTSFTGNDLPDASYYAAAGFTKDGIAEKVRREMRRQFGKEPVILEELESESIILAYAYLRASVPFTLPYFENREALLFTDSQGRTTPVSSFGLRPEDHSAYHVLRHQVEVLYCGQEDEKGKPTEFALDLCRDSRPNQVIVACLPKQKTLLEMVRDLDRKAAQPLGEYEWKLGPNSNMLVPNLNWSLSHHFSQLEGADKRLLNEGFESFFIGAAMQTVEFRLERSGVELESEAGVAIRGLTPDFYFDHPFLIVVKKRGAERPFFVMWVDNAELLCKP